MISREGDGDTIANVTPPGARTQRDIWRQFAEPRGAALAGMALYVAVFACVFFGAGDLGHGLIYSAIGVAAIWLAGRTSDSVARRLGDFAPLVVMPVLYGEIPSLIAALGTTYHDSLIQRWEQWVFGAQAARVLASIAPNIVVSEILHAGYLAYYPAIFAPALWLYWRGGEENRRGFAETVLALTVTYAVCWSIFAFFPVEGPRYEWGAPAGVPDGPARRLAVALLAGGSSRGAAFPSSHMAVSVVQAVLAWRWQRGWVAVLLTAVAGLVGLGAVYGGFHYGIDMIAGAALGAGLGGAVLLLTRSSRQ